MTKTAERVQARIQKYLENPIKNPPSVTALRGEKRMAKRRKAPTAKQLAARAAFAAKFGGKKAARRGKAKRRAPAATATRAPARRREEEEEAMELEENPRKKSRRKKSKRKAKRKTRRSAPKRKASRKKARRSSPKRSRRAAPKRRARRSGKRRSRTTTGKVHVVRLPSSPRVQDVRIVEKKRRRRKKASRALALLENPGVSMSSSMGGGYDGLFENPSLAEAYSGQSLKAFLVAAGGIAFGLVFARGVDRYIATMKPSDSGQYAGNNPWYGRNAAFVQQTRPGALRLGVQGVGALAAIGGAYLTRNNKYAPWALGGVALGFGSNLMLQVAEWFLLPRIPGLKIEKPGEATFANRMYVLEQVETQDIAVGYLEDWGNVPSLQTGQQPNPESVPGAIQPVLTGGGDIFALGGGPNGKLAGCGGNCGGCGGGCSGCNGGGGGGRRMCTYVVQPGDNLAALLAAAGVSVAQVNALNNGDYWVPGNQVVLPYEMCMTLTGGGSTPAIPNRPDGTIVFQPEGPGSGPNGTPGPGSSPRDVFTELPGGPIVVNPGTPFAVIEGSPETKSIPVDARRETDSD